ncbi:oxygen-independent coproporphyrinogen-3 oxidase [Solimonas aquatica]|uniref:Coproporphyrinogen-III oxidase n=2 Tax=Solimonas aquatica TaxID=489703 RepID=A0A1H9HS83_9GAMM|nr:oxygen-independent coproporphyrinogen-3 oxidase [Solimonas aquatica]
MTMMTKDIIFDTELIQRYGGSVPRYTSYPTALQFEGFGEADLRAAVQRLQPQTAPSLYLHVPFCAEPCFYCACTRVISRQSERIAQYAEHLLREIAQWGALWGARHADGASCQQLHFGGGTPTSFTDEQLAALMQALDRHFGLNREAAREYSIEIDPRTVNTARLQALADIGLNRVSFGVQDFEPTVQEAINRHQPAEVTRQAMDGARRAGFASVAVDLIYGLPRQNQESFARTLQQVIALAPDRVAIYAYAHMPKQFAAQKQIALADLPSPAQRLELLRQSVDTLCAAGYQYIGMDHFAQPDDDLARAARAGTLQRNFQGYSTHAGRDLIGMGMSAISRIGDVYAQNAKTLKDYEARIDAGHLAVDRGLHLSADDQLRREVIENIMCQGRLRYEAVGSAHGVDFSRYFADCEPALQALREDGLIQLDAQGLQVTPRGRPLVRNIARVFDRYSVPGSGRHSAAI